MAKSKRMLKENLKMIDVVIELLDARIPLSSKNPDIDVLTGHKPRLVVCNKADLADESVSKAWVKWFAEKGHPCIFVDALKGKGIKECKDQVQLLMKEKIEREKAKGRLIQTIRTMVVGIPNVGKSAFINKVAGKAVAVTGDRPGVTRGKQWVRLNDAIELLDTPGILWPKFEDADIALHLAFTGAIKDSIMDTVEITIALMEKLKLLYPAYLKERYRIGSLEEKSGEALLQEAGRNRGCLLAKGEVDLNRISIVVLDEFRGGKIGRISLERPPYEKSGD